MNPYGNNNAGPNGQFGNQATGGPPKPSTLAASNIGAALNAGVNSNIAESTPTSDVGDNDSTGWLGWINALDHAENNLGLSDVNARTGEAWSQQFPDNPKGFQDKYYFFAASGETFTVAYISDSPNAATPEFSFSNTDILQIVYRASSSITTIQTGESTTDTGGQTESSNTGSDNSNEANQSAGQFGVERESIDSDDFLSNENTREIYRENFNEIDPTRLVSITSEGLNNFVSSDNVRFDLNSSNIFADSFEDTDSSSSLIADSYSPIEKEGISVNRPKILAASDYDLIGDQESKSVLASSLNYSIGQHRALTNFYNNILFPEIDLLTDLEDEYEVKKNRLLKSIEFIKEIDQYKANFINTVTDFDAYGLQTLGFTPGLNATVAIRQAFYDLSAYIEIGGYFLANSLNGVYETPTGLSSNEGFSPRIIDNDFDGSYRMQTATNAGGAATGILHDNFSLYQSQFGNRDNYGDYKIYSNISGFNSQRFMSDAGFRSAKLYDAIEQDWTDLLDYTADQFRDSPSAMAAHFAQGLYVNMFKSYVVNTNSLANAPDLGEEYFSEETLLLQILGDAIDVKNDVKTLTELDNTKKLAQILRYNQDGKTIYPFERPNANFSGDTSDSVSGIEQWFDANIGNIIEGRETDFRGLDNFSKIFNDIINKTENKLNSVVLRGHGQIIFNEIVRALKKVYDDTLDDLKHHQPGLSNISAACKYVFSDYNPAAPSFRVEDVLENISFEAREAIEEGSVLVNESREIEKVNNIILKDTVRTGTTIIQDTLNYANSVQDDFNYYVQSYVDGPGGYMAGEPPNGEEYVDTDSMVAGLYTGMSAEEFTNEFGYGAQNLGLDLGAQMNALGEPASTNPVSSNNLHGGGANVNSPQVTTDFLQVSEMQTMRPNMQGMMNTDAGAAEYGYIGNIYDENGNQLPYNKAAEQGLIDAEMSSGILARKEELFRKLLFFIEMFASIVDESQDIFWNLAYNSVQAQLELHPSAPGHGTDHRRYHKYNKILSKSYPYNNFDSSIGLYSHMLMMINSFCSEVEKNIAYDIAVSANQYGITKRTPGEYSDATAVGVLGTIFDNTNIGLIYGRSTDAQFLDTNDAESLFLAGHKSSKGTDPQGQALTHVYMRALIMEITGQTCKAYKNNIRIGTKRLVGLEPQPNDAATTNNTYVTVNSGIDRTMLEAEVAKLFLPIVDNVDPKKGPVRWQINYGDWSAAGIELENQSFVERFVIPRGVEKTLAGEFSMDVEVEGHVVPAGDTTAFIDSQVGPVDVGLGSNDGLAEFDAAVRAEVENLEASVRAYFGFLLDKDEIVPYNFIDNTELPISSFASSPQRGALSSTIKACIFHREDTRRLMEYLKAVSRHYSQAQANMEGLIKDPNGAELFDAATLPGIEANEIIKYSSLRQTFLRSFLASEESGIRSNAYAPSSNFGPVPRSPETDNEPFVLNIISLINNMLLDASLIGHDEELQVFLGTGLNNINYGSENSNLTNRAREEHSLKFGRIIAVGLPAGYIDANKSTQPLDILNRLVWLEQEFEPLNGKSLNSLFRCYWPALFINRAEIMQKITKETDWRNLKDSLVYGTIDKDTGLYVVKDYQTISEYISENILNSPKMNIPTDENDNVVTNMPSADHIIFNHVLDALLKIYLDFYAGLNFSESSFSVNLQSNILYVDQKCIDNIDLLLSECGIESKENILDENKIRLFKDFYFRQTIDSDSDVAYDRYAKFVSITQSRLLSADQMTTMALVPNIFDRTFCFWSHMSQVSENITTETNNIELSFYDISDDGTVDDTGNSQNSMHNDFNSQVTFRSYSS